MNEAFLEGSSKSEVDIIKYFENELERHNFTTIEAHSIVYQLANIHPNLANQVDETTEANISGEILLMMLLLSLSLIFAYAARKKRISFFNESINSTLLGVVAGFVLHVTDNKKYISNINDFYINFFLLILLPPLVFESAYNLKRKDFFRNIGSILMFAVVGTLISIFTIAGFLLLFSHFSWLGIHYNLGACLAFGALISSTDPVSVLATFKYYPVNPNFFQLIFGESIMNDAVSIVFYESSVKLGIIQASGIEILNTIGRFILVFVGSVCLGFFTGYLTAIILKFVSQKRVQNINNIEIGLVLIIPWVCYLIASIIGLSGIVAILFNGLAQAAYTRPNLSHYASIVSPIK